MFRLGRCHQTRAQVDIDKDVSEQRHKLCTFDVNSLKSIRCLKQKMQNYALKKKKKKEGNLGENLHRLEFGD